MTAERADLQLAGRHTGRSVVHLRRRRRVVRPGARPGRGTRMSLMSHQSYGPRVAVPKILRILARQDVRATFFVPGFTAECHPDVVRAIVDAGHEIGHHGYLHEQMQGIEPRDRGALPRPRPRGAAPGGRRRARSATGRRGGSSTGRRPVCSPSAASSTTPACSTATRRTVSPSSRARPTPSSRSRSTGRWTTGSSTPSTPAGPAAASSRARPRRARCGSWRPTPSTRKAAAGC